jgi:hypothetical protein
MLPSLSPIVFTTTVTWCFYRMEALHQEKTSWHSRPGCVCAHMGRI